MDIGEIRAILHDQYVNAVTEIEQSRKRPGRQYRRAVEQVRKDMETIDAIMSRNFGMAYNPDLKIYE